MGGSGPFGEGSGVPTPIAVENFQMLKERQTSDTVVESEHRHDRHDRHGRTNLLNWDGRGKPEGLFPRSDDNSPDHPDDESPEGRQ